MPVVATTSLLTKTTQMTQEVMKAAVAALDLAGMYVLLTRGKSSGETTAVAIGVGAAQRTRHAPCPNANPSPPGWALADSLVSRLPLFWFSARGLEFSWSFLQSALDANIALVRCAPRRACEAC
jgi:hypothetical protein